MTTEVRVLARREERAVCPVCRDPIRPDSERDERCAQCSALYHPACDPCGECPTCGATQALLRLLDDAVHATHELPDGTVLREVHLGRPANHTWVETDVYAAARRLRDVEDRGDEEIGRAWLDAAERTWEWYCRRPTWQEQADHAVPSTWLDACESWEDLVALERALDLDVLPTSPAHAAGLVGMVIDAQDGAALVSDGECRWLGDEAEWDAAVDAQGVCAGRALLRGVEPQEARRDCYVDACQEAPAWATDYQGSAWWLEALVHEGLTEVQRHGVVWLLHERDLLPSPSWNLAPDHDLVARTSTWVENGYEERGEDGRIRHRWRTPGSRAGRAAFLRLLEAARG